MRNAEDVTALLGILCAILLLVVLTIISWVGVPLLGIWVLNTLFGMQIPYTFLTWLAAWAGWMLACGIFRRRG